MRPSPFLYTPQRTTQPYRNQPGRPPGAALDAMMAGRTMTGFNPQDAQRQMMAQARPGSLWWHLLNLSHTGAKLPQ